MANQDYVRYFRDGIANGISLDYLSENLLFRGYMRYEVEAALEEAKKLGPSDKKTIINFGKRKLSNKGKKILKNFLVIAGILFLLVFLFFIFTSNIPKTISYSELQSGISVDLKKSSLNIETEEENFKKLFLDNVKGDAIKGSFVEDNFYIKIGGYKDFDYNNDKHDDIRISLIGISDRIPTIMIRKL